MHKSNSEKFFYRAGGIVILLFVVSLSFFTSELSAHPWSCLGHNSQHTGQSPYAGPQSNAYRWKFKTDSCIGVASPAIGQDGTIYIRSLDGYLYPLTKYGQMKWDDKVLVNNTDPMKINAITSSPAIGSNGIIYIGSDDKIIYAIESENGSIVDTFPTENSVQSSPVIGPDGTIYIGSNDHTLYALTPTLKLKWKYETGDMIISSPALSPDGETVYVGSLDRKLYALHYDSLSYDEDDPNSLVQWIHSGDDESMGALWGSPAIGDDGTIYIGSDSDNIYAIDPNGREKWVYTTGGNIYGSPAIAPDGTVYVGSSDGYLYAFDPDGDGTPIWKYKTEGGGIRVTPAIDKNGTIYIGNDKGYVYAFNPQKKQDTFLWSYQTPYGIWSSAAIASDGTLYVGGTDGYVYAFGKVAPPANLAVDKKGDEEHPTFMWDDVPHATKYELEIARDENFADREIHDPDITDFTGEYVAYKDLAVGDYYWRVRVISSDPDYVSPEDNQGLWAEGLQFSVDPNIEIDITTDDEYTAGEPFKLTVTVADYDGNIIESYDGTVTVASTDPNARIKMEKDDESSFDMPYPHTFIPEIDHGIKTFYIISRLAGSQTISISFAQQEESAESEDIVINTAELHHFVVTQTIDGVEGKSAQIEVTAKDAYGNTITNYHGTIHISSSDTYAIISDAQNASITTYTFTSEDQGSHIFYIIYKSLGDHTITVSDTAAGVESSSDPIEVTIDDIPEVDIEILIPPADQLVVGESFDLTITIKDFSDAVITDYDGTITISMPDDPDAQIKRSASSNAEDLPISYTFVPADYGSHTFIIISNKAGDQTIVISSDKEAETKSSPVALEAGALHHLAIEFTSDPELDYISRVMVVTAKDQYGNTVTDYDGTILLSSSDNSTVIRDEESESLTRYTFDPEQDKGEHTFYIIYRTPGSQTITVSDPENNIGKSETVTVNEGDVRETPEKHITAYSSQEQTARILTRLDDITVQVTGVSGNPLSGVKVRFLITDMPDIEDLRCEPYLSDVSVTTDENGLASTSLILGCEPGTYTIRADFPDKGILYGEYVLFYVTASKLSIVDNVISDGTVEFKASDEAGIYSWYVNGEYQQEGPLFIFDPETLFGLDFAGKYTIELMDSRYNVAEEIKNYTVPVILTPASKIFLVEGEFEPLTLKGSVGDNIVYRWALVASPHDTTALADPDKYGTFLTGDTTYEPINYFSPAKSLEDPTMNPEFYIQVTIEGDPDLVGDLSTATFGPFWIRDGRIVSGRVTEKGSDNLGINGVAVRLGRYFEGNQQVIVDMDPVFTDQDGNYELWIPSNLLKKGTVSKYYFTAYKEGYVTTSNIELDASEFDSKDDITIDFPLTKKTIISTYTDIYIDPNGRMPDQIIIEIHAQPDFVGTSNEIEVSLLKGAGTITELEFNNEEKYYSLKYIPAQSTSEQYTLLIHADTTGDGATDTRAGFDDYVATSTFTSDKRSGIKIREAISDEISKSGGIVGLTYKGNHFSVTFDERDINETSLLSNIAIELKAIEYQVFTEDLYAVEDTFESTIVYEINAIDPNTGSAFRGFKQVKVKLPITDPKNVLDISLESLQQGYFIIYWAEDIEALDKGIGDIISPDIFIPNEEQGHVTFMFDSLGVFQIFYPIKNIEISSEKSFTNVGESIYFNASIYYGEDTEVCDRAIHRNVTDMIQWESSNPNVGVIENGEFKAVGSGETYITARKFNVVSHPTKINVGGTSRSKSSDDDLYGCFINSLRN
ncbi:MAG: PQQ-binding-like beta-propeller repeat protein [bacterium]